MKCIILAGGKGIRLQPLTYFIPKSLIPVKGMNLLERIFLTLIKMNIKEVIVVYNHLGEKICDYVNSCKLPLQFTLIKSSPQADTFDAFVETVNNCVIDDDVLLICGDVVLEPNQAEFLKSFHDEFNNRKADAWLCVSKKKTSEQPPRVLMKDDGLVLDLGFNIVNNTHYGIGGIYMCSTKILHKFNDLPKLQKIVDFLSYLIQNGNKVMGYEVEGIQDIDTISDLMDADPIYKKFFINILTNLGMTTKR